jgi:dipeptidase E
MRLLLISNSGKPFLGHCQKTMLEFLGPIREVAFVSAASFIPDKDYLAKVRDTFTPLGITVQHLDVDQQPLAVLKEAQAVLVGGGNTYRLLKRVRESGLLKPLREKVLAGMPFIGWSAGANLAGPTILTTNDWNVVALNQFDALNLVPFNINPHYQETDLTMAPNSETRDMRIAEYHQVNRNTVLGIEEQTCLWIENKTVKVVGAHRVRRFDANQTPKDFRPGEEVPGIF